MNVSQPLQQVCKALAYAYPSAVQQASIPVLLAGHDAWITAPTGTGKTAAYVLPALHCCIAPVHLGSVNNRRVVKVLMIVPTRELVLQLGQMLEVARLALKPHSFTPLKTVLAQGGVSINPQLMSLRGGADIVVGTPGRILDLVAHNALDLAQVNYCVLDEADKLLEPGFSDELQAIYQLLPVQRQTVCVSATQSPQMQAQLQSWLKHAQQINLVANKPSDSSSHVNTLGSKQDALGNLHPQVQNPDQSTVSRAALSDVTAPAAQPMIQERALLVDTRARNALFKHWLTSQCTSPPTQNHAASASGLSKSTQPRVLVFVASQYTSQTLTAKLLRAGVHAAAFHGGLTQGQRSQALAAFKAGHVQCLISTDLAARGIDIAQLEAVVNYDLPRSPNDYIHRIGRTGRAGEIGMALSFVTPQTLAHWRLLQTKLHIKIELEVLPEFVPTESLPDHKDSQQIGGIKGKRPSKKDKLRAAGLRPMPQS